jgi:hypothetical protein
MTQLSVWLLGTLAAHARGKVLMEATAASAAHVLPPDHGLCIAFGSDFQDHDEEIQREWAKWVEPAGRTMLLIPPFKMAESAIPVKWRIYRPEKIETDAVRLAKLLAPEVRYEVAGALQVATDIGGEWKNGGINTAYYRKHPHSGLFAITCLPLWSLTVLDNREALVEWLRSLHRLAGDPAVSEEPNGPSGVFHPSKDHFAMLLHLCANAFRTSDEALTSLADSPVLALPDAAASQCLEQLEAAGLAECGRLTENGREMLSNSPYAAYAEAMEASRQ